MNLKHPIILALLGLLASATVEARDSKKCNPGSFLGSKLLNKIERKVGTVEEWKLPPQLDEELKTLWSKASLSVEDKLAITYEKTLEARVQSLGKVNRIMVKLAARNIIKRSGWYQKTLGRALGSFAGSHYNPIFNSIYLSKKNSGKLSDYVVAIHEMEHAVDRNTNPFMLAGSIVHAKELMMALPTPFGIFNRYSMESKAIGAQWELMQRVPEEARWALFDEMVRDAKYRAAKVNSSSAEIEWLEKWRKNRAVTKAESPEEEALFESIKKRLSKIDPEEEIIDQIAIKSVSYAHLPKEEFIQKMREIHGYTLSNLTQYQYGLNGIKLWLLATSGFGIYRLAHGLAVSDSTEIDHGIEGIQFTDLKLYLEIIRGVMRDTSETPLSSKQVSVLNDLETSLDQEKP